ncbi:MAG TPA: PASTA domain-containing protein [Solirubrobacteraceae bacterium]|nr:PASTA domain-containing protein [Solirubrobacteraceae bacterium]
MRICATCGRENPDDADFCVCGEYLRWEPTSYVQAVAKPPGARPAAVADRAPTAPDTGPETRPPERPEAGDPGVTLAPAAVPAMAAGTAALTLRRADGESEEGQPVTVEVEPGARVAIVGLIRNQSDVVDNFDLSVRGLPEDWWTVTPATVYLVPYGTGGIYEQEVEIHLHPPRAPEAHARAWPFEVVATSRAHGGQAATAPASVAVRPYFEIATELHPERRSGRLKARYTLTVRNRANARIEVAVEAEDTDGECQFRFAQPSVAIEPGNAIACPFTCLPPRQVWLGRALERRFQVTATPIGTTPPTPQPPRVAVFRQKPWLPWWLAIVAPVAVALAVLVISQLPKQAKVPNLKGAANVFAAQKLVNSAGFQLSPKTSTIVDATKQPGAIADQSPRAGTKAKRGSLVTVAVYTGTGRVAVPSVLGTTPGLADQALRASQLTLGAVSPQPLNPAGKIRSQIPLPGTKVAAGTAVAVFMAPAGTAAAARTGTSTPTRAAAATAAAATPAALAAVAAQAGKGPIAIPPLSGDPTAAAGRLSQLGLVPVATKRLATVPVGQLAGTVPAAGAKVPKGAQVDLLVSSGSPHLSYDDGRAIHVIDPATGKPAGNVAAGAGPDVEASWSPDGTHLVVSEGGRLVLDQPGAIGAAPFPLTPPTTGVADLNPAFAPTTKALIVAFIQRGAGGAKLCFATIGRFALNADCTGAPGWDLGGQVDWSPDGSTILVLGTRNHGANFGLLAFTSNVPFSTHAADWGHGTVQTNASDAGQGVFAGAFSPDGKRMALVSNLGSSDFHLYVVPAGTFSPTPAQMLPVRACQVAWRSDGQELAVMQPDGPCGPTATGTVVGIDLSNPRTPTTLATQAAHPQWQPVANGG